MLLFLMCLPNSVEGQPGSAVHLHSADGNCLPREWDSDCQLLPIDLATTIRLAQTSNLDIAQARQVVAQAQAIQERARVQMLPTIGIGSTFVDHEGRIQQAVGNILNSNRNSLFVGGGTSLNVGLGDAIFAPLAARQVVAASQAGVQRVTSDALLAVADAYFGILRGRRRLARSAQTLEFLTAEQPSESRAKSKGLLPLVRDIVEAGVQAAYRAELARLEAEVLRRRDEQAAALIELRLATAELARLIRLDPRLPLWPVDDFRHPVPLPGEEWAEQEIDQLVSFALQNRPEIAENQAVVQAAMQRLRAARVRPFLPSVVINFAYGGFGGSPNFVRRIPGSGLGIGSALTQSGRIDEFGQRSDFDVSLIWRMQNLGFGNQSEVREQRAIHEHAQIRLQQAADRIVTQVVQTQEQVQVGKERVGLTRSSLYDDRGDPVGPVFRSIRLNFERIRAGEGRPLEVLDSIRGLNDLLEAYAQAMTDYERSQFRLLVVLGVSPEVIVGGLDKCVRCPGSPNPGDEPLPRPRVLDDAMP
jgi:outer membrane protein TolC